MKKILLFVLLVFVFVGFVYSQTNPKNKKIENLFKEALYYYSSYEYKEAERLCKKIIKRDKNFTGSYILLAQINAETGHLRQAIKLMMQAISIDSNYLKAYVQLATYLLRVQSLDSAMFYAVKANKIGGDTVWQQKANKIIRTVKFRKEQYTHPQQITIHSLPRTVNTTDGEYFPTISADGRTLYYTKQHNRNEDIYFTYKIDDTAWSEGKSIGSSINTEYNEGAHTFSNDGKTMIFVRCDFEGCNLYFSQKIAKQWNRPIKFPSPINSVYWDSQPSLSPDGNTLYFTSSRPGGKGGADIWETHYLGNGKWSDPKNLGDSINTAGDEMSPFIHFDNRTLYFISDTHIGMGGFDIFMSKRDSNGKWHKPINLGYPINDPKDQFRLTIDYSGRIAYFSTFVDSIKNNDIFWFILPENMRPTRTIYLRLYLYSALTRDPLLSYIQVINLKNNDTIYTGRSDYFLICLPERGQYAIEVMPPKDYLFFSENIDLTEIPDSLQYFNKKIYLKPIEKDKKIVLKNVFFKFDSWQLENKSYVELNKVVLFLKQNPTVKIEIGGHTDNKGSYQYNIELSQKRAKSVAQYLISQGIAPERIVYKGYGYTEPIADNSTEEGRKLNRRTEIKIIEK